MSGRWFPADRSPKKDIQASEPEGEVPNRRAGLRHGLIGALILVVLAAPLWIWRAEIASLFANRERALAVVRGAGSWGPLVLIGLSIAQTIIAPMPGQVINFVAGYAYGFWLGTLYSWLGMLLGSVSAMALARIAGRPLVNRLVNPAALDRLDRIASGQGLRFFFLVFLVPFLPDDLACFLAGLTPLPVPALIAVAAVGRIPSMMSAVWVGTQAGRMEWQGWLAVGVLVVLGVLVAWRYGERIQERLLGYTTQSKNRIP